MARTYSFWFSIFVSIANSLVSASSAVSLINIGAAIFTLWIALSLWSEGV